MTCPLIQDTSPITTDCIGTWLYHSLEWLISTQKPTQTPFLPHHIISLCHSFSWNKTCILKSHLALTRVTQREQKPVTRESHCKVCSYEAILFTSNIYLNKTKANFIGLWWPKAPRASLVRKELALRPRSPMPGEVDTVLYMKRLEESRMDESTFVAASSFP